MSQNDFDVVLGDGRWPGVRKSQRPALNCCGVVWCGVVLGCSGAGAGAGLPSAVCAVPN